MAIHQNSTSAIVAEDVFYKSDNINAFGHGNLIGQVDVILKKFDGHYGVIPSNMALNNGFKAVGRAARFSEKELEFIQENAKNPDITKVALNNSISRSRSYYHLPIISSIENGSANLNSKRAQALNNAVSPANLGAQQTIDTLTYLKQDILRQKFYEVDDLMDYCPITSGEGGFSSSVDQYTSFMRTDMGDDVNWAQTGTNAQRRAKTDTGFSKISVPTVYYINEQEYNIIQVEELARNSKVINLIQEQEIASQKKFALAHQKMLLGEGLFGSNQYLGLANLFNAPGASVLVNNTLIPTFIGQMNSAVFQTLANSIYEVFRANSQRTSKPNRFIIPESDYNQIFSTFIAPGFPLAGSIQGIVLQDIFARLTKNPDFKILPNAYFDKANNSQGRNLYLLINSDRQVLESHFTVPFQSTAFNTYNGFNFQSIQFAQTTGTQLKRDLELVYFYNTASL